MDLSKVDSQQFVEFIDKLVVQLKDIKQLDYAVKILEESSSRIRNLSGGLNPTADFPPTEDQTINNAVQVAKAIREFADLIELGAEYEGGGLAVSEIDGCVVLDSDLAIRVPTKH